MPVNLKNNIDLINNAGGNSIDKIIIGDRLQVKKHAGITDAEWACIDSKSELRTVNRLHRQASDCYGCS